MAVVCLMLVALLAAVQVAHVHPLDGSANHCPLCIAMHSAAPVASNTSAVVLVALGIAAPVFRARSAVRLGHPTFCIRPPPAGSQDVLPV